LRYGPFDALRQVVDPGGNSVQLQFDRLGRIIRRNDPNTGMSTAACNGFGEVIATTDGAGRSTTTSRDLLGRATSVVTADGTTTLMWDTATGGVTRLGSTTSPDHVITTYRYDQFGRPSNRTYTFDGELFSFDYTYDAVGRSATLTFPEVLTRPRLALTWAYSLAGFV
jgi:YD repeat-containing protein